MISASVTGLFSRC